MNGHDFSSQLTAIIVDDDADITEIFGEYLQMQNINVLAIGHDGKSAVELYQRFKPDLVFLDLIMPEYDGIYGLEKIKHLDHGAKVIMMTADMSDGSNKKMKKLGANVIIYKPFDLSEILTAILRLSNGEFVRIEI